MSITKYEVKRRHFGDRDYFEGDIREAEPAEVKHLVDGGVLAAPAPTPTPKTKSKGE